jgi:CheY-like chemotaxis protein
LPRILVVDDEPLISMLVEDWLVELGCEVVGPAHSVNEGLDLAEQPLDGAILDVNLAGENCYSVASALQARGVPFAFATGDGGIGMDWDFEDPILLAKPFNFDGVRAVLDKLLAAPPDKDGT